MKNISYLDAKYANDTFDMLTFDLNSPKFADFLIAFADIFADKFDGQYNTDPIYHIDSDDVARNIVAGTCSNKRLCCNFNSKYFRMSDSYQFSGSIYLNYDGKLVVYAPDSYYNGIQCNKTNEECVKLIAKTIKQLILNKLKYDRLLKFTNEALTEINAMFDEMCSKNDGDLVPNTKDNTTEFSKTLNINNAKLELLVKYSHKERYKIALLFITNTSKNTNSKLYANKCSIKYNLTDNRYSDNLSLVLDRLDFGDENKEWNADNKSPSIFKGFTIGEVYNIYCLLADKKSAIKKMSDEVKKEYIIPNLGINPVELELYKQFAKELKSSADKKAETLYKERYNLLEMVEHAKDKAAREMKNKSEKLIREYEREIKKYNNMLAKNGSKLRVSTGVPDSLMPSTYF